MVPQPQRDHRIMQMAVYASFLAALNGLFAATQVFAHHEAAPADRGDVM
jgi:4-carboxymuconolactone decarboxylase